MRNVNYGEYFLLKKIAVLFLAAVILLGLTSCGGKVSNKDLAGEYEIESMGGENPISEEELAALKGLGLEVTLDIKEDGTASMMVFGQGFDLTYDAKKMIFIINEEEIPFEYKDGKISFTADNAAMVFKRVE